MNREDVSGVPGVQYRDLTLMWNGRMVSLSSATIVDLLSALTREDVESRQGGVPWWCVIMPSAFSLARWLSRQDLRGVRVLEVGCGSGISGLAAAMAGADVLVTDRQPAALELALRNARRNGVRMKAAAADWRDWPVHGRFDCVIGSDITYESSVFEALLHVLEQSLVPGGEVLLADPGRPATAAFRRRVLDAGWAWESFQLPKESVIAGESSEAIYLHHVRPPH